MFDEVRLCGCSSPHPVYRSLHLLRVTSSGAQSGEQDVGSVIYVSDTAHDQLLPAVSVDLVQGFIVYVG